MNSVLVALRLVEETVEKSAVGDERRGSGDHVRKDRHFTPKASNRFRTAIRLSW